MMDYARKEGEILFFGFGDALRGMLSALCGVSGDAVPEVIPRLCIGDGEDLHACDRCTKTAAAHRAAVLLIGGEKRGTYHLSRPFLFSAFTDVLREILCARAVSEDTFLPGKSAGKVCRVPIGGFHRRMGFLWGEAMPSFPGGGTNPSVAFAAGTGSRFPGDPWWCVCEQKRQRRRCVYQLSEA